MNYYQLTTGIDDSDDSDNDNDDGENLAIISGIRRGGGVNQIKLLQPSNPNQEHSSLHQAVNKCLSESTVNDIMKEYDKNSDNHNNNNSGEDVKVKKTQVENLNNNGVVMRRKSSNKGSSYSHRASQRFSKLLEGVTSLVSMSGYRQDEVTENQSVPSTPGLDQDNSDQEGPVSLPYWVEASHNICKEDRESSIPDESGYSSIAETASMSSNSSTNTSLISSSSSIKRRGRLKLSERSQSVPNPDISRTDAEIDKIEEKISEIFDSMNFEADESLQSQVKRRGSCEDGGRDRRRKTVSGYFHDWATWMGSVENGKNKADMERTNSLSTDVTEQDEEEEDGSEEQNPEDDLWSTWDKILVRWNCGTVTKGNDVKELVRKGIPQHLRGIVWQMLSGAHTCDEKSRYLEFLETDSACEKMILRDIARTYPEHDMFKKKDGAGQESLFNVMKAYSVYDREVGYCQGTAFIVGLLLMMMPEEETFSVLVMMMSKYRMRDMFKPSMTELGLCIYQLDTLIETHLPDLHLHFQSQAIHTNLFASRWFLTLFTSCVSVTLSSRILDSFLCEGREVIFRLALTLLSEAKTELLQKDIEGVTKYFQTEMPERFEADQDSIFTSAFNLSINQKMMKKIEKEYLTMKSKKTEDEMEIRRLRTENALLRQKMDSLEQESSDLADRLIQDQVTRAEEQESLYLVKQELETTKQENDSLREDLTGSKNKCDNLQQELHQVSGKLEESFLARKETEKLLKSKSREVENLKTKIKEMLNNKAVNGDMDADLKTLLIDEEVVNIKRENNETKRDLQVLKTKVFDLKQMWRTHIQRTTVTSPESKASAPKKLFNSLLDGSGMEVTKLEEELITCRLSEVDTLARLQECQERVRDMEHQTKSSRLQLSRQDAIVIKLQEEAEQQKRKHQELQAQLRESEIKMVNMEGKLKDERLMSRITEAENSQLVAELRQQISSLEFQKQEIVTLDNLDNLNIEDNSDEEDEEDTSSSSLSGINKNHSSMSTSTSSLKLDSPKL